MENNYFDNSGWLLERLGRFTASEISNLFVSGRRDMTAEELEEEKKNKGKRTTVDTLFGGTAITYIRTKAAEILTQEVKEDVNFKQAEWGKNHEAEAWMRFEKETGLSGEYYGAANPKFFPVGDFLGYSPDWLSEKYVADIKCPYNSSEHLKNMMLQSTEDLAKERWEYYCQLQFSMLHSSSKCAYFVSYDPRFVYDWMQIKILTIYPDQAWIQEYNKRIEPAIDELKLMVKKFTTQGLIASYDPETKSTIIESL